MSELPTDAITRCINRAKDFTFPSDAPVASSQLQALLDENKQLIKLTDVLEQQLVTYGCICNLSKCRCGYDDAMDAYEEFWRNHHEQFAKQGDKP